MSHIADRWDDQEFVVELPDEKARDKYPGIPDAEVEDEDTTTPGHGTYHFPHFGKKPRKKRPRRVRRPTRPRSFKADGVVYPRAEKYSAAQPRDHFGRWSSGGIAWIGGAGPMGGGGSAPETGPGGIEDHGGLSSWEKTTRHEDGWEEKMRGLGMDPATQSEDRKLAFKETFGESHDVPVYRKKIGDHTLEIEPGSMPKEDLDSIANQVTGLATKYPPRLDEGKDTVSLSFGLTGDNRTGGATMRGYGDVMLNPRYVSSDGLYGSKPAKAAFPDSVAAKLPNTVTTRDYVIQHEWGHVIDNNPDRQSGLLAVRLSGATSLYGAQDPREAFAEAFTLYTLGGSAVAGPQVTTVARSRGW